MKSYYSDRHIKNIEKWHSKNPKKWLSIAKYTLIASVIYISTYILVFGVGLQLRWPTLDFVYEACFLGFFTCYFISYTIYSSNFRTYKKLKDAGRI
ncbi:hypothetical protein [Leeuwenhoekiella sp. H156]|uniref:hypothetical protein n=1 Tax=Leeuwenhoekiella sp. H156 TaxID=3450128 RepID=UPI003FA41EE4